jgi:HlyD family secretion protein
MPSTRSVPGKKLLLGVTVTAALGAAAWVCRGKPAVDASEASNASIAAVQAAVVSVETVAPRQGGIERCCLQPGSVEPFEAADLYAKVSGFLIEQKIDIGFRVKAGDVLARLEVSEYEKQVKHDKADVVRAQARVEQMRSAIATAEADLGAATAGVALAEAEKKSKGSYRAYREKQRDRMEQLVARMAIDVKLAEEHEDHYQAAAAAELAAAEAIGAAKQKEAAARARVRQAQADVRYAEAEVATALTRLEKAQVFVDYGTIRSPYDGVITRRNYHLGDFVRSADAGGERVPLCVVERTDVMRVVIQIPERDVPFVDCGDPAVVEVDALPGVTFQSHGGEVVQISRLAASEDPHTRMMRTEVHLVNPDGKLRRGMFGRVKICLHPGRAGALCIPSTALVGKADGGKGSVRVVRAGKAQLVALCYGVDNGSEIEVLSGLNPDDRVIVRASGPLSDGTPVAATPAKASSAH